MCGIIHLLVRVCGESLQWVSSFIQISQLYLILSLLPLFNSAVSHNHILLDSGWEDAVSAVIYMLSDDIHSSRSSAIIRWQAPVLLLESCLQLLESHLVLFFHLSIAVRIYLLELLENLNASSVLIALVSLGSFHDIFFILMNNEFDL